MIIFTNKFIRFMRYILLFLCQFFLLQNTCVNAQGYLKISMQHPTDSTQANGAVSYQFTGLSHPVYYKTFLIPTSTATGNLILIDTGSTVSNLRKGTYLVIGSLSASTVDVVQNSGFLLGSYFDLNDIVGEFTLGSMYIDTLDTATVIGPVQVTPPSSANTCDGYVLFNTSETPEGGIPFVWNNIATGGVNLSTIIVGGIAYDSVAGMCIGRSCFQTLNTGTGHLSPGFTFFFGSESIAFPPVRCIASANPVSATGQCDGSVTLTAAGGSAPYTWHVDSVSQSSNVFVNVCEGLHQYYVSDSSGFPTVVQYIVVGNLQAYYQAPDTFNGLPVVDTVYINSANCNYNYNITADSALLDSVVPLSPPQQYIAYFTIWQQGQSINIIDTVMFNSVGVNQISMTMYCDTTHRSVQGTVTIVGYVNNGFPLSVNQVKHNGSMFKILPNPATDYAIIEMETAGKKDFGVSLHNVSGQVLQHFENLTANRFMLNTKQLPAGVYIVTLTNNETTQSKQLVKF